jgi:NitT/TauT family transport system substrate-binding protein
MNDQLIALGVDPNSVQFVSFPINDMQARLGAGDVDAAIMAEPSLQEAASQGATPLMDPFIGADVDFPWSGWISTDKFAQENPNTVAAFQRGYLKGLDDVVADRKILEETATKHLKIDANTASLMKIPTYPTTTDPIRLQRVADLMAKLGDIPAKKDTPPNALPGAQLDMHDMVLQPTTTPAPK